MQQPMAQPAHDPMAEFVEIYDFWHTPWWQTKTFYIVLISFLLIVLSILIWSIIRFIISRKKITPWEQALHELAKLKQMPLLNDQDGAKRYFELRTILKKYIDARYGVYFADKTDEELIVALPTVVHRADIVLSIKELLYHSEQAVFAAAKLSPSAFNKDVDTVISIIKHTIPEKK